MISTEHKLTCIFFIQGLLILRFLLYTYVLYIVFEVNVGSYYNISVQTFRCHLRKPYCLADFYRYITLIFFFFFCFKYDAYLNLKKIFEYKGKRIINRSKGCTCISQVRHSDYSLPGTLIRHCSCCRYFLRSKKN